MGHSQIQPHAEPLNNAHFIPPETAHPLQSTMLIGIIVVAAAVAFGRLLALIRSRSSHIDEKPRLFLEDMARPQLNAFFALCNQLGKVFYNGPLVGEALIEEAKRKTGLADLGEQDFPFREGLQVFLDTANDPSTNMSALGRFRFKELVIQLLSNRLRIQELLKRHPEILDQKVERPVFIAGLPRSGTTHLYWLIAKHHNLRAPLFYELLDPVISSHPIHRWIRRLTGLDIRLIKGWAGVKFSTLLRPDYQAIHDSGADKPEEDMLATAITFQSLIFSVFVSSDKYLQWLGKRDPTIQINYLERVLQVMQWQDAQMGKPPRRWLLKSIDHLQHLAAIREVFPDCTIVQIHRDPVAVFTSAATLVVYGCGMNCTSIDLNKMGQAWADMFERMFKDFVADQEHTTKGSHFNLNFDDFVKDNMTVVRRLLGVIGEDMSESDLRGMLNCMRVNPRFRRGQVVYDCRMFGLNKEDLGKRFQFYTDYFNVPKAK